MFGSWFKRGVFNTGAEKVSDVDKWSLILLLSFPNRAETPK